MHTPDFDVNYYSRAHPMQARDELAVPLLYARAHAQLHSRNARQQLLHIYLPAGINASRYKASVTCFCHMKVLRFLFAGTLPIVGVLCQYTLHPQSCFAKDPAMWMSYVELALGLVHSCEAIYPSAVRSHLHLTSWCEKAPESLGLTQPGHLIQ